ncbi:MAG: hypothetical protein RML40_10135 [Bacteroidota bacterium]|nr:hypothetical protein [Candidatus Kapabacteria bacterium]MDW8220878.1 hypothetical protein [Bacteroidota bacterium]
MKRYGSVLLRACACSVALIFANRLSVQAQVPSPTPTPDSSSASSGVPKALQILDERALPFLSRWTICEAQVQKIIQQFFKTNGKEPGPDLAKISVWGEPKKNGKYEIYRIQCGSAVVVKKEIDELMLQGVKDLIAEPIGQEGEEKYCHDFVNVSQVGGRISTEIEKKIGIGENNYRMPTSGRQYYSISAFDQMLRVGATNWWIHNSLGNDNIGYMFWYAGEARIIAMRPLIDNYENNTRRVIPNLLKLGGGVIYRIVDDVANPNPRFTDFLARRRLNMGPDPKITAFFEGTVPLGDDNRTSVFGARISGDIPIQRINESIPIGDASTFSQLSFTPENNIGRNERLQLNANHPRFAENPQFVTRRDPTSGVDVQTITPLLRTVAQATLFYTWWLEIEGSDNPPDNIFRIDAGINYSEVVETALIRTGGQFGPTYFATANSVSPANRGGRGLVTYTPQSVLDWIFLKFEYRNETSYPFGFSIQYSNQILLGTGYLPLFGNWLYLEAKYARVLRELRSYEASDYFMISPVFRILIPR